MREHVLRTARLTAAALVAGPLMFFGVTLLAPTEARGFDRLASATALLGLLALPVAWRLGAWLSARVPATASEDERARRYPGALIATLAVTEAAALGGLVAWMLSRNPVAILGLATHVLLAGVVWPTEERLERFIRGES